MITLRLPAMLWSRLLEPRFCSPRSWGDLGLGTPLGSRRTRLRGIGVERGAWAWAWAGPEGAGYLNTASAPGRGAPEAPGVTHSGRGPGAVAPDGSQVLPGRPAADPEACEQASAALRVGQGCERPSEVGQAPRPSPAGANRTDRTVAGAVGTAGAPGAHSRPRTQDTGGRRRRRARWRPLAAPRTGPRTEVPCSLAREWRGPLRAGQRPAHCLGPHTLSLDGKGFLNAERS